VTTSVNFILSLVTCAAYSGVQRFFLLYSPHVAQKNWHYVFYVDRSVGQS